jgi:hypothetical protein
MGFNPVNKVQYRNKRIQRVYTQCFPGKGIDVMTDTRRLGLEQRFPATYATFPPSETRHSWVVRTPQGIILGGVPCREDTSVLGKTICQWKNCQEPLLLTANREPIDECDTGNVQAHCKGCNQTVISQTCISERKEGRLPLFESRRAHRPSQRNACTIVTYREATAMTCHDISHFRDDGGSITTQCKVPLRTTP